MSRYTRPPVRTSKSLIRRTPWSLMIIAALLAFGTWLWLSPPNSFHPLCTYTMNARVSADIEASGEKLSSTVVYQNSRSRNWISIMNSAGCKQKYGNALVYRLRNDNILIVPTRLCRAAEKAFAASRRVDVIQTCTGKQARQNQGYIIDSAQRPSRWRTAIEGVDYRILRMTATSTWAEPSDNIAAIAPNLLKADFKYVRERSIGRYDSPERAIHYSRRHDVLGRAPDRLLVFEVRYQDF